MVTRLNANHGFDAMQLQAGAGTVINGINADGQIYTGSTTTVKGATVAVTAASAASTTAATYTIGTVSTVNPLDVGQLVTTAGFSAETYFNGTFVVSAIGGSSGAWTFTVYNVNANFTVASATVMGTYQLPAQISTTPSSAGTIGQIIRGVSNQISNLQEWQNSAGTILARVEANGYLSATQLYTANGVWGATLSTLNSLVAIGEVNSGGTIRMTRQTTAVAAPGANMARTFFLDGTTAGTLKLVTRAGVSGVVTTLIDNIDTTGTDTSTLGVALIDGGTP
jgi:hypothetical protein